MNVRQVIPCDAIPSVDDPAFGDEYDGDDDDLVVVVESSDPSRAYPVRYLQFHEIVNDVLDTGTGDSGGDPIAVTWCPLCGSAVVYGRDHRDQTLEFGVSGKLADDDLVMYDRETGSEWKQSSGDCISGAFSGDSLSVRPATTLSWRAFCDAYPDGTVLQPLGGRSEAASADGSPEPIEYDSSPYDDYVSSDGFGLAAHRGNAATREWIRDDDLGPKDVVLGVEIETDAPQRATGSRTEAGGDALGFPLSRVTAAGGVVQTAVGGQAIVVFATEEDGIHAFADPGYSFESTEAGVVADGTTWNVATGHAADGRRLERVPTKRLFAFAWQDDHGTDAFYRPD